MAGDIYNEACNSWEEAVAKSKAFIQGNSHSVVTWVNNICFYKNLWGVNNQASNDETNSRSRTIMFGEVF